jgi:translation elongation factor EF-G
LNNFSFQHIFQKTNAIRLSPKVQAAAEALSGVYAVLGRRRARILREELREGSGAFLVHAYLPVEASFGLADEMRRRSSGAASASLLLSHWERLQVGGARRGVGGGSGGGRCARLGCGACWLSAPYSKKGVVHGV